MTSRKPDESDKRRGLEIAGLRKAAGFSQAKLAEILKISTQQLGKNERGENRMPASRYELLKELLQKKTNSMTGFSEVQVDFSGHPRSKQDLIKALRQLRQEVDLVIDIAVGI